MDKIHQHFTCNQKSIGYFAKRTAECLWKTLNIAARIRGEAKRKGIGKRPRYGGILKRNQKNRVISQEIVLLFRENPLTVSAVGGIVTAKTAQTETKPHMRRTEKGVFGGSAPRTAAV